MSDNWITLIPTDPYFVPTKENLASALSLLKQFVPDADEVESISSDKVMFVDCGGNWSGVLCPKCNVDLEDWFFSDAMETAHADQFRNLVQAVPCCGASISLNDLNFVWAVGFARCKLEAMNPNIRDLSAEQIRLIETALQHSVRRIWIHI